MYTNLLIFIRAIEGTKGDMGNYCVHAGTQSGRTEKDYYNAFRVSRALWFDSLEPVFLYVIATFSMCTIGIRVITRT